MGKTNVDIFWRDFDKCLVQVLMFYGTLAQVTFIDVERSQVLNQSQ